MIRLLTLTLVTTTALSVAVLAAPTSERVRGTVESIAGNTVTVHPEQGADVKVSITDNTKYASVVKSNLSDVAKGSYIGTATKGSGDFLVALEVVVFPPSMRGTGDGHYPWDKLPDPTAGNASVPSAMTNGDVATASPASTQEVSSAMTNGNVQSSSEQGGAKKITVTYKGGEQTILVPPTVPIVALQPADKSVLKQGAQIVAFAKNDDGTLTAGMIAVGDGVKPPM
ncbi:MAG: hypothetical protein WBQ75_03975 [Acetobacteraceae bacterium]